MRRHPGEALGNYEAEPRGARIASLLTADASSNGQTPPSRLIEPAGEPSKLTAGATPRVERAHEPRATNAACESKAPATAANKSSRIQWAHERDRDPAREQQPMCRSPDHARRWDSTELELMNLRRRMQLRNLLDGIALSA